MGNGTWEVGSGEWDVGSGKWEVWNGECGSRKSGVGVYAEADTSQARAENLKLCSQLSKTQNERKFNINEQHE